MEANRNKSVLLSSRLLLIGTFIIGTVLGLVVWNHIFLPFSNPHHVVGVLPKLGFNSMNNSVRFLVFVGLPIVLMICLFWLAGPRRRNIFAGEKAAQTTRVSANSHHLLFSILTFIVLLSASLYRLSIGLAAGGNTGLVDHYHEGEVLSGAVSYENGQTPYRDFYMLHGVYQDPGRAILAFSLFGRRIAAPRIIESIHMLLLMAGLASLLLLMHGGSALRALIHATILGALLALGLAGYFQVTERDILIFSFLCVLIWLLRNTQTRARETRSFSAADALSASLFSFLPAAAYAYTLDRGFILTAALIVLWPVICFVHLESARQRWRFAAWSLLGLLAGVLVIGWAVRWAYFDFLRFTFLQLPSYKELMDGMVWDFAGSPQAILFRVVAVLMAALAAYWMAYRLLSAAAHRTRSGVPWLVTFLKSNTLEIALTLLALVTFNYGLQFSDRAHIAAGTTATMLLLSFIFVRDALGGWFAYPRFRRAALVVLAVSVPTVVGVHLFRVAKHDLISRAFPVHLTDEQCLTDDYRQVLSFLKDRVSDREDFVSLTNEGTWYYLLNRPCPIKFPVLYFAAPDYFQRDIVAQLEAKPVKWILFKNALWCNAMSGVTNEEREPIVFDYVRRNFHLYTQIASHEIWVRNT